MSYFKGMATSAKFARHACYSCEFVEASHIFLENGLLASVGESGKSAQHGSASVGESGESAQHGSVNVGESGESAQHGSANVGESGESAQHGSAQASKIR